MNLEEKVKLFKALGHKTRFEIFKKVLQTPYVCSIDQKVKSNNIIKQATCVGTIAQEFDYSLPTISKHLKELKDAQLITMNKIGNKIYVEPNKQSIEKIAFCFNEILKELKN